MPLFFLPMNGTKAQERAHFKSGFMWNPMTQDEEDQEVIFVEIKGMEIF